MKFSSVTASVRKTASRDLALEIATYGPAKNLVLGSTTAPSYAVTP